MKTMLYVNSGIVKEVLAYMYIVKKLRTMRLWFPKTYPKLNTGGEKHLSKGIQTQPLVFNKFMIKGL